MLPQVRSNYRFDFIPLSWRGWKFAFLLASSDSSDLCTVFWKDSIFYKADDYSSNYVFPCNFSNRTPVAMLESQIEQKIVRGLRLSFSGTASLLYRVTREAPRIFAYASSTSFASSKSGTITI